MSILNNNDINYPEMDYFMNESVSDVVFLVDGQRLPALKSILSSKSLVLRAMFSDNTKESKDKEVVIKDTTFEAFKTLIQFLYCDQLVLKDDKNLDLIEEVMKLSDRYEVLRIKTKISEHMKTIDITDENIDLISRIAKSFQNEELIENVMTFIDNNLSEILDKNDNQLIELNDSTHNHLLRIVSNKCRKYRIKFKNCCREDYCPHRSIEDTDYFGRPWYTNEEDEEEDSDILSTDEDMD